MKYHSKVNVIDILTCIHVINLNECCSFKSVISVVDNTYPLLNSYSEFPGTGSRDYDVGFFCSVLFCGITSLMAYLCPVKRGN